MQSIQQKKVLKKPIYVLIFCVCFTVIISVVLINYLVDDPVEKENTKGVITIDKPKMKIAEFSVKNYLFSKGFQLKFPDYVLISKNY